MNHDFRTGINICRWLVLVTLANISLGVQAQTAVYDRFKTASGIEIATGPNYVPKTVEQARGQGIWDGAVKSSGGQPNINGDYVPRNASGNPVPVKVTAAVPAAEVTKAVGRTMGRLAVKVAVPITVGLELYDLGVELGHIFSRNPDGTIKNTKSDPAICTVAPCYSYSVVQNGSTGTGPTPTIACQAAVANYTHATYYMVYSTNTNTVCSTNIYVKSTGAHFTGVTGSIVQASAPPSPAQYIPATEQEFLDAVAAKSGWPTGSAINRVMDENLKAGDVVKTGPLLVTGPATSVGTQRVTNNTTNNTTRTDTTTHNHSYAGNTMTTNTVYNSVVINNITGDTISNESTTETGKAEPPQDDKCAENSATLGCAEFGEEPETPMPKKTENVTFTPVVFQSNATCPAPLSIAGTLPISGSFNYSLSYSGVCDGAGIVRLFLLAGAALVGVGIFVGGLKT
ncbi:MAG: virulence factor TspB C-terminal domain-related protein [Polaromonas sp.]|uniref:virulence factor TspB C-terminal domain-related protein n=1 Tax=Polaromonas sp. TaxID=1869339 RepID=UPI002715D805|nr:virulence factor TspB C-terminal domain-related protein [Polaromonas sp.]MDO9114826.1 virulence factor TspB C-terminal domain-related protein [Polaromonas sp.]